MGNVRRCRDDELTPILAIINSGAQAYRDAIPADRWHELYMDLAQLRS